MNTTGSLLSRVSGTALAAVFLAALGFFAPWGEGLQQAAHFDLSKIFVALAVLFIPFRLFFFKERAVFPEYFNYFVLFTLAHTVLAYALFFRQELVFGVQGQQALQGNFVRAQEGAGMVLLRRFLLVLFGYALAATVRGRGQLTPLFLGYGAGLTSVLLLGGYRLFDSRISEERIAGGYLDPNAFGLAGMTMVFLSALVLVRGSGRPFVRALAVFFILAGIAVIFGSGCRGVMLGSLFGLLLVLYCIPGFVKKFWLVTGAFAFLVAAVNFFPYDFPDMIKKRFNYERIQEDGGAGRTFIWKDYLQAFSSYALIGVGMGRSLEVTRYSWTRKWAVPHNNYLAVWVESGAVGILLYLMALYQLGRGIVEKRGLDPDGALSGSMVLGMFSAWLVMSFFMDTFAQRETWIILGVAASYARVGDA
ncbi:MAG: O-antigen ligase family protein [Endomicrobiales bacterium]